MPKQKRGATRQPEALALLSKDHRMVQKLFKEFEKLEDNDEKRALVKQACNELSVHARMEEEVFYPAIRRALQEKAHAVDLIAEAEVEHEVAKRLIEELERMTNTDDEHFSARFTVLGEYVNHHIEEEETKIFREIQRAKLDLGELAEELRQRKESLREQLGLEEASEGEAGEVEREHEAPRRRT
jgi:hemerythrin-like domain-containing protein